MHCCGNPVHDALANLPWFVMGLSPIAFFLRNLLKGLRSHDHGGH